MRIEGYDLYQCPMVIDFNKKLNIISFIITMNEFSSGNPVDFNNS